MVGPDDPTIHPSDRLLRRSLKAASSGQGRGWQHESTLLHGL